MDAIFYHHQHVSLFILCIVIFACTSTFYVHSAGQGHLKLSYINQVLDSRTLQGAARFLVNAWKAYQGYCKDNGPRSPAFDNYIAKNIAPRY